MSAESSLCATIHKRAGVVHTVLPLGMGASGGDFSPVRHTQSPHTKNGSQTRTRHKPDILTYKRTSVHTYILTYSQTHTHTYIRTYSGVVCGAQQATRHPRVASVLCFPHVLAFVQPLRLQHAGYRASARTREHVEGEQATESEDIAFISSHGYPCGSISIGRGRRGGQTTCSLVCYQCCLWLSLSLSLYSCRLLIHRLRLSHTHAASGGRFARVCADRCRRSRWILDGCSRLRNTKGAHHVHTVLAY